jgi:hypothetical protein
MGFLMKKTYSLLSPFNSHLSTLRSLHGCACLCEKLAPKPHCAVAITENLSAPNSIFTRMPIYR